MKILGLKKVDKLKLLDRPKKQTTGSKILFKNRRKPSTIDHMYRVSKFLSIS